MCVRVMYPFGFIRSANELARVAKVAKQKARRGPFCNIFCSFFFLLQFLFTFHQTTVTETQTTRENSNNFANPFFIRLFMRSISVAMMRMRQPNAEFLQYFSVFDNVRWNWFLIDVAA